MATKKIIDTNYDRVYKLPTDNMDITCQMPQMKYENHWIETKLMNWMEKEKHVSPPEDWVDDDTPIKPSAQN
jgi:hypothetical protein